MGTVDHPVPRPWAEAGRDKNRVLEKTPPLPEAPGGLGGWALSSLARGSNDSTKSETR